MTNKDNTPDTNGWSRAELFVMNALQEAKEDRKALADKVDALDGKLTDLRLTVAKNGALWGAVSGTIVAVATALLKK